MRGSLCPGALGVLVLALAADSVPAQNLLTKPEFGSVDSTERTHRTILITGDPTPDGSSTVDYVGIPGLDRHGHVTSYYGFTSSSSASAIMVEGPGGGANIASVGQPAPGGGTFTEITQIYSYSPDGNVAFMAGIGAGSESGRSIYGSGSGGSRRFAGQGDPVPTGGVLTHVSNPHAYDDGSVMFRGIVDGDRGGLYQSDGGLIRTVIEEKMTLPGWGLVYPVTTSATNSSRQVALQTILYHEGTNTESILLHDGTALRRLVGAGEPVPGGAGTFRRARSNPDLNDRGWTTFVAEANVSNEVFDAVYRHTGTTASAVARAGGVAPGGGAFGQFSDPSINNLGQIAFAASLAGGGSGVFRANLDGSVQQIARQGDATPDGLRTFDAFVTGRPGLSEIPPAAITSGGQVAFVAAPQAAPTEMSLFIGDAKEVIPVARHGQALEGSTIQSLRFGFVTAWSLPALSVNDFGQIAYNVRLADGRWTNQLFTPTLNWRSNSAGAWDESDNWTVGLAPASVHPVVIDRTGGGTVAGPAEAAHVKSLTVGGGGETANLRLSRGSRVTADDGFTILPGGVLLGSGQLDGDFTSDGAIELQLRTPIAGGHDVLDIDGAAVLAGDIFIVAAGPLPDHTTFDVLVANAIADEGVTVHLPAGPFSYEWVDVADGEALRVTHVPEPVSIASTLIAYVALGTRRRRRRRCAHARD